MSESPKLSAELVYTLAVNAAMQQNHVPLFRQLTLTNLHEDALGPLMITLTAHSAIFPAWQQKVENLGPKAVWQMTDLPVTSDLQYLANLTEKESTNFLLRVTAGEDTVFENNYPLNLLAYDQWQGSQVLPELLAAYSTPNHPQIATIIKKASTILGQWTGNPSLDGYQSLSPDRVRKQVAALYTAIAECQIVYATLPASFEVSGQRIRLADTMFTQGLGNCLEMSLLLTACLEAMALHPLLVLVKGHAFAGAWLVPETFADSVNDDPALLSKRLAAGIYDITLLEATAMNAGKQTSFEQAEELAAANLTKTNEFELFIDIQRARHGGIRPLPLRIMTDAGWRVEVASSRATLNEAPSAIELGPKLVHADAFSFGKQQLWERKLLDLSLRNNLLNMRLTKGTVQFIIRQVTDIEDLLANGEELLILPKPADWNNPLQSAGIFQALQGADPLTAVLQHELGQKRLRCYLPEADLHESLTGLYRSAKTAMEENGANTLYLALGLLRWYETDQSERPRFAPILLMPVDMVRRVSHRSYIIRSREEETVVNITLLEMLRQDFGIVLGNMENLPRDGNGVDVRAVFSLLRQAIMAQPRWDVEEQAFLGHFSFSKFVMWHDIHEHGALLRQNRVVDSLVNGRLSWEAADYTKTVTDPDQHWHPRDLLLPINADGSQLEAIGAAIKGESFVLHGPPGTGKSQTITNIIANALYQGKRVLFVAEKMAALEVVEKRMEDIGLGPFCLELHSNKARKSAVLEQLKKVIEVARRKPSASFEAEAGRLMALRTELNAYHEALHKTYPAGLSLYEAIGSYSLIDEACTTVPLAPGWVENLGSPAEPSKSLTGIFDLAEQLQAAAIGCGGPHHHPLEGIATTQYSQQAKNDAGQLLQNLQQAAASLSNASQQVCQCLQWTSPVSTQQQTEQWQDLVQLLLVTPDFPASLWMANQPLQTMPQLVAVASHGQQRDTLEKELLADFDESLLNYNAADNLRQWKMASEQWFLPKWWQQRKLRQALQGYSRGKKIITSEVASTLETLLACQQEAAAVNQEAYWCAPMLGPLWQGGRCHWANLHIIAHSLQSMHRIASALAPAPETLMAWKQGLSIKFSDGHQAFIQRHQAALTGFVQAFKHLRQLEAQTRQILQVSSTGHWQDPAHWLADLQAQSGQWLQHLDRLRDWTAWNGLRAKAVEAGLQTAVDAVESGQWPPEQMAQSIRKSAFLAIAQHICDREPALSSFNGKLFDEKVKKFGELTARFQELCRHELYATLAGRIPNLVTEAAKSSETGILQKAIANNGRGISIRQLFQQIPNLLPRLAPCMLMSPISVAQYLPLEAAKFDLVIFDEASQMPTCEAVGAMARGHGLVVVGDPRQMPPTSFFSSQSFDEDHAETEDLESILDDCLALPMPSRYLSWHYRSRHESLIAFSNARYYDNRLLTFPSNDDQVSKLRFVPVEGHYDRGRSKHNVAEAKAITAEILSRLQDPRLQNQSMGVVTFNSVQQKLIQDLLDEAFAINPALEALALQVEEPLFVKNLENVQGDERDIILFSVGYGRDAEGRLYLNFGPLNREGGWRRLNVAVSRARHEMVVFSTLRAADIDLARTGAEGVAGLRAFLEYAEKGKSSLALQVPASRATTRVFENILAERLAVLGFEAHVQVGCSDFKIEAAIVHPNRAGRYLMAILLDGPAAAGSQGQQLSTARDRHLGRQQVLEALGWQVHRVWTADWWDNPQQVIDGILAAIDRGLAAEASKEVGQAPMPKEETPVTYDLALPAVDHEPADLPAVLPHQQSYQPAVLPAVQQKSADEFLLPRHSGLLVKQLQKVIESEAPVSRRLLYQRLQNAWGIGRLGTRMAAHLDALLGSLPVMQTGQPAMVWPPHMDQAQWLIYRTPGSDDARRDAEDLPPEEIANAMADILAMHFSLSGPDLVRETSRLFGFGRIGTQVEAAMQRGLQVAIARGQARQQGSRYVHG